MLPTKLQLEVVTPEKKILSETVDEVVLPGSEGYLGVLPGHAPLLTALKVGRVEYKAGGVTRVLAIAWGFAEILPEKVTILADIAENPDEIDLERAEKRKAELERQLKSPDPEFDFAQAQASLSKQIVRIELAMEASRHLPPEATRRGHRPHHGVPKTTQGE